MRDVRVHDCKRLHAAILLDRHPPGPIEKKRAPNYGVVGDGDEASS